MPFIWDDSKWLLVDEEDPYDKNRFVVARKVSIKPNKKPRNTLPIEGFSVDQIHRQIRKFGEIESIEILAKNEPEAHVTFVSDRSAYLMLLQYEYNKAKKMDNPFEVEPVDSWEQPKENNNTSGEHDMEVDEQTPEMFMLNEDCLLHLFKFLDVDSLVNMAEVCKMFNRLIHQHCFPRIQKYKVDIDNFPELTLNKIRRTLLCIGQHLTDLSYTAEYDKEKHETRLSSKCLTIITQLVGQNIRRAFFFFEPCEDNVSMMAPILQHLESLKIVDHSRNTSKDIDFPALCPNLIDFELFMNMSMIACCKPWPTLRSLSIKINKHLQANTLTSIVKLTLWQIPLNEVNLINIVCYARRLSVLNLWRCKLDFSDELIAKLVDVLKSYRKESDGALRLILDGEELKKLDSTKNKEMERYLQLQQN